MTERTAFLVYVLVPGALLLLIYWHFYTAFIEQFHHRGQVLQNHI